MIIMKNLQENFLKNREKTLVDVSIVSKTSNVFFYGGEKLGNKN